MVRAVIQNVKRKSGLGGRVQVWATVRSRAFCLLYIVFSILYRLFQKWSRSRIQLRKLSFFRSFWQWSKIYLWNENFRCYHLKNGEMFYIIEVVLFYYYVSPTTCLFYKCILQQSKFKKILMVHFLENCDQDNVG